MRYNENCVKECFAAASYHKRIKQNTAITGESMLWTEKGLAST